MRNRQFFGAKVEGEDCMRKENEEFVTVYVIVESDQEADQEPDTSEPVPTEVVKERRKIGPRYTCEICERGFKTVSLLRRHENLHNGVKPHACDQCKKKFSVTSALLRHVRYIHTKEKPHRCAECDYAAVELAKLRRHARACHTGQKPYQCPHCTYASAGGFNLKRHIRTHTGEKLYSCDICVKRFTQANTLKAHMRTQHKKGKAPVFSCDLCPSLERRYSRKVALRAHMRDHMPSEQPLTCKHCGLLSGDKYSHKVHCKIHKGQPFKCDQCHYASPWLKKLNAHQLKKHAKPCL